jgi:hypothetical protein
MTLVRLLADEWVTSYQLPVTCYLLFLFVFLIPANNHACQANIDKKEHQNFVV